jgi:hypothetical protein
VKVKHWFYVYKEKNEFNEETEVRSDDMNNVIAVRYLFIHPNEM